MTNPTDKSENDWRKKWEVKPDKAEIFARQIVEYITEKNTGENFEADVDDVAEMLREFAASLQPMTPELDRIWARWRTFVRKRKEAFFGPIENALRYGIPPEGSNPRLGEKMTNDKNENTLRLTNGNGTFLVSQIVSDNLGPLHAKDSRGAGYSRCQAPCNHEFAPEDATVWHDDENTEELWEVK